MSYKRINISISEELLERLDRAAREQGQTRSAYIADAVVMRRHWQVVVEQEGLNTQANEHLLKVVRHQGLERSIRFAKRLSWTEIQD